MKLTHPLMKLLLVFTLLLDSESVTVNSIFL